jgi:HD-GYP domain-containing protein (c-di-GMP phosphodiesterase class II)
MTGSLAIGSGNLCQQLLEDAVRSAGGTGGAIFAVDGPARVSLVALGGGLAPSSLGLMEAASLEALRDEGAQLLRAVDTDRESQLVSGSGACLAVPIFLDGPIIALLVVTDPDWPEPSLESCVVRIGPTLARIGLSVDRLRMQADLECRGEEIVALRQQLDVYAIDFRSTYLAERHRSQELAAALAELELTYNATVQGLAVAVEAKDECTGGHIRRVMRYGMMLTNLIAPEHANDPQFQYGFLLHDVGKLSVPDLVLTKTGPLTEGEWELMRQHPDSGRSILADIPFLAGAREIVHAHHERWDGTGYPRGLAGEEIPLGAQIFPICDAFDAMTSDRPYRKALFIETALGEIRRGAGTQFRPDAVEAFLSLPLDELEVVRDDMRARST